MTISSQTSKRKEIHMMTESISLIITKDWNELRHGLYYAWSNISDFPKGLNRLRVDYFQTISRYNMPHELLIEDYRYMTQAAKTIHKRRVDSLFFLPELKALEKAVPAFLGYTLKYSKISLPLRIDDNSLSDHSISGNYNHLKTYELYSSIGMKFAFATAINSGHK